MSSVMYSSNELISVSNILKWFSWYMEKIKNKTVDRIWILKNNSLEAVIIAKSEYEKLKEIEMFFEENEHRDIFNQVKSRLDFSEESWISFEDMMKKHKISA